MQAVEVDFEINFDLLVKGIDEKIVEDFIIVKVVKVLDGLVIEVSRKLHGMKIRGSIDIIVVNQVIFSKV